jgi:hypothetical protein
MRMKPWLMLALALFAAEGAARAGETVSASAGERFDWGLGGYVGIFSASSPIELVTDPGHPGIESNYIAAATATATLLHFESVPLTVEFEAVIAKRFGDDTFFEFGALPILRWRYFPWNDTVYTTLRFGPVGASYTTGISQWEKGDTNSGEHLLNFLVFEITAADPDDKSIEGFARLHHRSDAFGLVGDFEGSGDDFLSLGLRKRF